MPQVPNEFDKLSDEELAAKCARRPVDEEAWFAFYARFVGFVRRQVRRRLTGPSPEVDDLVQEAFTKIFRILPAYDWTKARLKTYISHVIFNLVIDYFRYGVTERAYMTPLDGDLRVLQIRAAQDPGILQRAAERIVASLPDPTTIEVSLDLIAGRDVKEIEQERNMKEHRVYAIRKKLKDLIRDASAGLPES